MNKVIINPSIATEIQLLPIGKDEKRPVYFEADENWPGTYSVRFWNSPKKNTEYEIPEEALTVAEKVMTLLLWPSEYQMPSGSVYFEIWSDQEESIIFKGESEILL